jgi:rubrerythrin
MCGNPRKTFNELTIQEKKHFQELEEIRDRHSNGLVVQESNETSDTDTVRQT